MECIDLPAAILFLIQFLGLLVLYGLLIKMGHSREGAGNIIVIVLLIIILPIVIFFHVTR